MKNIPVNLNVFELFVTAPVQQAEYQDDNGQVVLSATRDGEPIYELSVFMKSQVENQFGKLDAGEEIKIKVPNVDTESVKKGRFIELVKPTVSYWRREKNGRTLSGLSWNAAAVSVVED